jgi:hypothetical protein
VVPVEVYMLPAAAAGDGAMMTGLAGLVNEVYAVAERGMWVDGAARSSATEFADLTRAGQCLIALARKLAHAVRGLWIRCLPRLRCSVARSSLPALLGAENIGGRSRGRLVVKPASATGRCALGPLPRPTRTWRRCSPHRADLSSTTRRSGELE